VFGRQ
jgi:hypothetical protein